MLHYVHQLVVNFVCLLFAVEQMVYGEYVRAFLLKTAACKTLKLQAMNQNNKLKDTKLFCSAEGNCRAGW